MKIFILYCLNTEFLKENITYFPYGIENFGYGKKNQTFLLNFEKKILGKEKSLTFLLLFKKNFG